MTIRFIAMPSGDAAHFRAMGVDAYGLVPERGVADGGGIPCRHCLKDVEPGEPYLTIAYRPFPALQPYAETGPVFLHAEECARAPDGPALPQMLRSSPDYIVRGYGHDDRIVYGTGGVVATDAIAERAEDLFERADISYVHVRSARNNCFQCRVERAV